MLGMGLLTIFSKALNNGQINKYFYTVVMIFCYILAGLSLWDSYRVYSGKKNLILKLPGILQKIIHKLIRERF